MEKEKVKVEKAKESPQEKDMVDLAVDAEEEKDAVAEKEEAKAEKENSLDKWVRKVTVEKESLVTVEKVKDLCAIIAERQTFCCRVFFEPWKRETKRKEYSECSR